MGLWVVLRDVGTCGYSIHMPPHILKNVYNPKDQMQSFKQVKLLSPLRRRGLATSSGPLQKTMFFDLHKSLGGKMVPFAGYELPVQYEGLGVLKEHVHTRTKECASLFDVSHMGQIKWTGKDAIKFIEQVVVGDIQSLKPGEAKLSLIMNEKGGIVDDTVITNAGDFIYMVVNGACKEKDMVRRSSTFQYFTLSDSVDHLYFRHTLKATSRRTNLMSTWTTWPNLSCWPYKVMVQRQHSLSLHLSLTSLRCPSCSEPLPQLQVSRTAALHDAATPERMVSKSQSILKMR